MGGRASREKGARGERELADYLTERGFPATRNARNGISTDDIAHSIEGVHIEAKRQEKLSIPAWVRQCERDAGDRVPVVAFRSNGQPWRAVVPLDYLLELIGGADE